MFKRMISLVLVLILLTGIIPLKVFATNPETMVDTDNITIEGTNGFGTLLSQSITESQEETIEEESEYSGGYSVTDLLIDGNTATVSYISMEEAILIVALYTEDGMQMLTSGKTTVTADATDATVTIEGTMPEYFLATAYLVDTYDLSPLCATYDTPRYTQEMQELLASTVDDYDPDWVLNLNEDETTNFAVYAQTTKIIEYVEGVNTVASVDDETTTYVIKNADEQFTTLQMGDVFAYGYGENDIIIVKVASITVDGTNVTITGDDTLEMEEVFDYVKIDGEGDDSNLTIDDSTAKEGVVYQDNSDNVSPATVMPMNSDSGEASASISLSFEGVKLGGDAANVKLTGSGALSVFLGIEYYVTKNYQRIEIRADVSLKGTVGITGAVEGTVKMGNLKFDIIPAVLRLGTALNFVIKVEGKVEASLTMALKVGCIIDHGKQGWDYEGYCTPEVDVETKFEGSLFVGLELEPNAEILYGVLADISLTAEGGREYTLEKELNPETSDDERHLCDNCFSGEIKWKFTLEGSAKFLKMKKLSIKAKIVELSEKIGDIYYTAGMSWFENGNCPNLAYKLTVNVVDTNDSPVKDAVVTAGEYSGTTDKKGIVELFLPVAEYELSVTDGDITRQHNFYMDSAQKVKVRLSPDGSSENIFDFVIPDDIVDDTIVYISGKCGDDLLWSLDNYGRLIISGTGPMWNYSSESAPWYSNRSSITEVWLGGGFMDEVTSIGDYAFYDCANLTSVVNADSVTTIGEAAFANCSSLRSVEIPDGVITIGERAFKSCTSLNSVEIPDSVITLGASAFAYCTSLTSVKIPDSVTTIASFAFTSCTGLTSVTIPDSVTAIGNHAFYECTSLTSVTFPDSVTIIGDWAFMDCDSLTSVTVGNSITTIGASALAWCDSLTEIIFWGNAPTFGDIVFSDVTATAYYPAGNATWTDIVMYGGGGTITWVPYTLDGKGNMILNEAVAVMMETEETTELTDALVLETEEESAHTGLDFHAEDIEELDETVAPYAVYDGEYSTVVTDIYTLKTASFSGLVPDQQYVLLAMVSIDVEDPLAPDNLLYIEQAAALEDGTLVFQYVQRIATDTSYVVACGASNKDLNDAEITFPEMIADGEVQVVNPTVVYDGKTLTEGQDYTILGTVSFKECGVYTCYIRGVRNYTGLVECSYIVGPLNVVETGTCGSDLTWSFYDNGLLTISGTGEMTKFSNFSSLPWYNIRSSIVTVIINQGVKSISSFAFYDCGSLESVTIPDSVTAIGDLAFYDCSSLTSVTIPDKVTTIGDFAFYDCDSLESVTIPDSVTTIEESSFQYCNNLTSVKIGKSVTAIKYGAFKYCSSLTSVTIPESVTTIGDSVFSFCTSLTGISVNKNNSNYSNDNRGVLFDKDKNELIQAPGTITDSYEIPDSVTTISDYAFAGCTHLISVTIPESVTAIGDYAFSGCTSLNKITFTGDAPAIEEKAFSRVTAKAYYPADKSTWNEDVRQNYGGTITWLICCNEHNYEATVTEATCTEQGYTTYTCSKCSDSYVDFYVDAIGHDYAYGACTHCGESDPNYTIDNSSGSCGENLTWTLSNDGVLTISGTGPMTDYFYSGNVPWNSSSSLITAVNIGDGVTTIGASAFESCINLTSVEIPDNVTFIGENAFYGCTSLVSMIIPDSVHTIGRRVFYDCTSLTSVTISSSVDIIEDWAFAYCTSLTSVIIPEGVTLIGYYAFYECTSLTSVTIPDGVTTIYDYAFRGCSSLTSVEIPDSVKRICEDAFYGCESLISVRIPDSVLLIGEDAFYGCTSLTGIYVDDKNSNYSSDEWGVLFNKDKTLLILAPGGISGHYRIPGSVTTIYDYAFESCTSLTSVVIPTSVTTIHDGAFRFCTKLRKITFMGDAPIIAELAFNRINASAYYFADNLTWNADALQGYGGNITWMPYTECVHEYIAIVAVPTCTEIGYTSYNCTHCGDSYLEDAVPALGHTEAFVAAKSVTCTEVGLTEGKYCSVCNTVIVPQEVILATGHAYDYGVVTTLPGCETTGIKIFTCQNDKTHTYTEVIPKIGHTEVIDKAVAPTCTEVGLTEGKYCSVCNTVIVPQEVILATGHAYDYGVVTTLPGCETTGIKIFTCQNDKTHTYTEVIPKIGHTEVIDKAVAPTCTETGLTEGSHCSVCGEILVKQEIIEALGHTEVVDKAVEPTCTETGLTEGKHCSVCNEIFVKQEVVEALGHAEVVDKAVEPTCTKTGLTVGKHCSVCNEVLIAQEEVEALGHTEVVDKAVAPTCTETGLTEGKHCSVCNEVLEAQKEVEALGHIEVIDPAVEPTFETSGLTEGKHCSVCHEVLVAQEIIPAKQHTVVIDGAVEPTCTETGLTEGSHCSVCGEVFVAQEVVDALGHTEIIDEAVAPTCTETGLTEGKHCSVCNEVLVAQTEVSALGHIEVIDEAVVPTCTTTGLTEGKHCSVCNEILVVQEVVEALGHTNVIDKAMTPTCTETGLTEGKHCSVCNEVFVAQEIIAALGHTEVIDPAVEPTEIETGLTEGKHCSVCGEVLVPQEVIPVKKVDVYYYGDISGDGTVNASDALAILKHAAKLDTIEDELISTLADINGDGNINASDALEALKVAAKLTDVKEYHHIPNKEGPEVALVNVDYLAEAIKRFD